MKLLMRLEHVNPGSPGKSGNTQLRPAAETHGIESRSCYRPDIGDGHDQIMIEY